MVVLAGPCGIDSINTDDVVMESSDWTIETISFFGGSSPPALAVDSANRPVVLHCPPGEVWLSIREGDGGWTSELVAETVAGGVCGKLSLGPDGDPHITLPPRVGDPGQMYAFKHDGLWHFEPAPFPVGGMAVDSGGVPYAVGIPGFPQQGLLFSRKVNLSWETELVDPFPASHMMAHWESLVVDSNNSPHILYYADAIGEVRYAYKENGIWKIEVVDAIGNIQTVGRQGSLALDSEGNPYAAYAVRTEPKRLDTFYTERGPDDWKAELVRRGYYPALVVDSDDNPSMVLVAGFPDHDLLLATRSPVEWVFETISESRTFAPQFPDFERDRCDNPHVAFYSNDEGAVLYATKGEPCPPEPEREPSVSLDIDPSTLNLKSKGRWVTAYLTTENASICDMDISSILLQDTLTPERWNYQDDVLMLKFDRQELISILEVGDSVEVKITGKWEDGSDFEALDYIRVIDPGKK